MDILAVYGSSYGQAEAVLRRIAAGLEEAGHHVEVHDGRRIPRELRVEDYDAVVIAASIIMGRYQRYVRRFVRERTSALADRPSAFVSVNGHSPESSPEWRAAAQRYVDRLVKRTGWTPRWTATFSGALRYREYDFLTRWMMKKISEKTGGPTDTTRDYEFTDWEAVDRFAARLASELLPANVEAGP